jgi:hypothetical protein
VKELRVINHGAKSTYVRWQEKSVIDITFATPPAAGLISNWRVIKELESCSNHLYAMDVTMPFRSPCEGEGGVEGWPRWSQGKFNRNALMATVMAEAWPSIAIPDPDTSAYNMSNLITRACDASMSRSRTSGRRAAYWWTEEIVSLKRFSVHVRHAYQHTCRRRDRAMVEDVYKARIRLRIENRRLKIID